MRIAIDARMMGALYTRGIGRYVEELIRAMLATESGHTFTLLVRSPERSPFLGHPSVEHVTADVPWYTVRESFAMSRLVRSACADVLHVPHWNVPLWTGIPLVVTIHDLILFHAPSSARASTRAPLVALAKRLGHRFFVRSAVVHAAALCVPTSHVAQDLTTFFPTAAAKTFVTGEGVTRFPLPDFAQTSPNPFLLYVGSAYPHKRLDLLLYAWQALAPRYPCFSLIVAGEEDVFMARMVALARQLNLHRVHFTGRVTEAELAGLYTRAHALVFPSSLEGFGLPPIEALSFGCPVISSDAASLREVLPHDHATFFRSGDADDMIRAIESVLVQPFPDPAARAAMAASVASRHSWEKAAERTLDVYARIGFLHASRYRSKKTKT